jgi:hypothetical protein
MFSPTEINYYLKAIGMLHKKTRVNGFVLGRTVTYRVHESNYVAMKTERTSE